MTVSQGLTKYLENLNNLLPVLLQLINLSNSSLYFVIMVSPPPGKYQASTSMYIISKTSQALRGSCALQESTMLTKFILSVSDSV